MYRRRIRDWSSSEESYASPESLGSGNTGSPGSDGRKRRTRGCSFNQVITAEEMINEDFRAGGPQLAALPCYAVHLPPTHPTMTVWRQNRALYDAIFEVIQKYNVDSTGIGLVQRITEKEYLNQDAHRVYPLWPAICSRIIDHLDHEGWLSLQCLRFGPKSDYEASENPVTILLTVPHDTEINWTPTREAIVEILRSHNLLDIAVSILRGHIQRGMAGSEVVLPDNAWEDATKLGASIGPSGSTLGAVLEVQSPYDGKWFSVGLTCFHCAIATKDGTERGAAEKACFAKWKADGIKVDDPHRSTLRFDLPALKDHQHRMSIITREEERVHKDPNMIEGYETTLGSLSQNSAIKQRAEDFFASGRAYLGNVWCASGIRLSLTTPPSELDWALIMLKSSRIGPNKIPPQSIGGFVFDNDDLEPPFTRELVAGQSLFKVGRRTGFTHGFYDGLYSVNLNPGRVDAQGKLVRTPTYERAIACCSSEKRFSKEGDSGSVIFNSLGQFVGLLWAGNEATNTTYFTPWKTLFEDILKMTGAKDIRVATQRVEQPE